MKLPRWAVACICLIVLIIVFISAYAGAAVIASKYAKPIDTVTLTVIQPDCSPGRDSTQSGISACDLPYMEIAGGWERDEMISGAYIATLKRDSDGIPTNGADMLVQIVIARNGESAASLEELMTSPYSPTDSVRTPITVGTVSGYELSHTIRGMDGEMSYARNLFFTKDGNDYGIQFIGNKNRVPLYEEIVDDAIKSITFN
jgi:hypothetical protein